MNYEELKKQYGVTGNQLIKYGNGIMATSLVIAGIVAFVGVTNAVFSRDINSFLVSVVVAISLGGFGLFIKYILTALGELVINTEIVARNSCEAPAKTDIKTVYDNELPDL